MTDRTAPTSHESQRLARLKVELNGPLRSSLNALSLATNLVAAEQGRLRPRGQEALQLLCQEVEWQQSLCMHLLRSLDAIANDDEPPPLPPRPSGR